MTNNSKRLLHRYSLHILIAVFILELAAFTALQYRTPDFTSSLWGMSAKDSHQFAQVLFGRAIPPLEEHNFRACFHSLLIALYITYAVALIWLRRRQGVSGRKALATVAVVGVLTAVFFPPSLSSDSYTYAAYAQMPDRNINPYFHSPQALIDSGAPISEFLPRSEQDPSHHRIGWDHPAVYGPVWTVVSVMAVRIAGATNTWASVLAMKLIEAAALLVAAVSAGRIAGRHSPQHVASAILIVGLNPLALIEGVGSGHNDLLMIAFALLAVAWLDERRPVLGGLALGASIGVKFMTLGLLPWLLIDLWRASAKSGGARAATIAVMAATAAALAPTVICYAPYWRGLATLGGLAKRNQVIDLSVSGSRAAPPPHVGLLSTFLHPGPIVIMYAVLTVIVIVFPGRRAWVFAWGVFSTAFIYTSMAIWFPWYLLWPWIVLLACGLRTTMGDFLCFSVGALALTLSVFYTFGSGQLASRLLAVTVCSCLCIAIAALYTAWRRPKKINKNTFEECA